MTNTPTYAAMAAALLECGFDQTPSEYHGALIGALCVRPAPEVDALQVLQAVEPETRNADASAVLGDLQRSTLAELASTEALPQLLLPDDSLPLAQRAAALGEWCEGFLYGIASKAGINLSNASDDVQELLRDVAEFTKVSFEDGDEEEEEAAFIELVEYLRAGTQLTFMELSPRNQLH